VDIVLDAGYEAEVGVGDERDGEDAVEDGLQDRTPSEARCEACEGEGRGPIKARLRSEVTKARAGRAGKGREDVCVHVWGRVIAVRAESVQGRRWQSQYDREHRRIVVIVQHPNGEDKEWRDHTSA
jgi:hypothetical protein